MRCEGSTGGLRACNDQQSSGGGSVQEGGEGGGAESAESAEYTVGIAKNVVQ